MTINKEQTKKNYHFTPREDTTKRGAVYAVLKRDDGLTSVVRANNGKMETLEKKIKKEIVWQDVNNPIK